MADHLLHREWMNVSESYLKAHTFGYDPMTMVDGKARFVSPEVIQPFVAHETGRRLADRTKIFKEMGGEEKRKAFDEEYKLWKNLNKAPLKNWNPDLPDWERQAIELQLKKKEMPEALQQDLLTWLNSYQLAVRQQSDPNYNVMDDPELSHIAKSVGAASNRYGEGEFFVGQPEAPEGTTVAGRALRTFQSTILQEFGEIADVAVWLGIALTGNLDSDFADAYRQQTRGGWMMDRHGNLQLGLGKINAETGPYRSLQLLRGKSVIDIEDELKGMDEAWDWDRSQIKKEGIEFYAHAAALASAGLLSFMGTGGPGLMKLGTKGMAKLLGSTGPKLGKLNRLLIGMGGMSLGSATHSMLINGRVEGYGAAAIEGAKLGPILWAVGALGAKAEKLLATKETAPLVVKKAMQGLVGMTEGAAMTGGEVLLHKMWTFMRDPTEEHTRDWASAMTANMIGFGMMKAMTGTTIAEMARLEELLGPEIVASMQAAEMHRKQARKQAAGLKTEKDISEFAAREKVSRGTVREYAKAFREKVQDMGNIRSIEDRMEIEKMGADMTDVQREQLDLQLRERKAELAEQDPTIEIMEEMNDIDLIRESIKPEGQEPEPIVEKIRAETPAKPAEISIKEAAERIKAGKKPISGEIAVRELTMELERAGALEQFKSKLGQPYEEWKKKIIEFWDVDPVEWVKMSSKEQKALSEPFNLLNIVSERMAGKFEERISDIDKKIKMLERTKESPAYKKMDMEARDKLKRNLEEFRAEIESIKEAQSLEIAEAPKTKEWVQKEEKAAEAMQKEETELLHKGEYKKAAELREQIMRKLMEIDEAQAKLDEAPKISKMEAPPEPTPGRPKSLDIQPQLQMEEIPGTKDMRRSDLEIRMRGLKGDPIQVPIRTGVGIKGRYSTAGLLGWYRREENQIRIRDAESIIPMTHEFGHAFDQTALDAGLWMKAKQVPEWMRQELLKAAETYPRIHNKSRSFQISEGFAEFWGRWLLGDPRLPTEVPKLFDWMTNWIAKPEMAAFRKQLGEVQALHRQWRNLGAQRRIRAGRRMAGAKLSETEKRAKPSLWHRVQTAVTRELFDDLVDLRLAQDQWWKRAGLKESDVPATLNPTKVIDALRMNARSTANHFMSEGTYNWSGQRTGESVKDIINDITPERYEDFLDYIISKRVIDLENRGIQSGFSKLDALEVVKKLESPEFIKAQKRIREYANRVLEYGVEAGSISEEAANRMIEAEPFWIPFQRALTLPGDVAPIKTGASRGVGERAGGPMRIRGHGRAIKDPMQALGEATEAVVSRAHQHLALKSMYSQMRLLPKLGGFVTEVPRDVEPRQVMVDQLQKELTKLGQKKGQEKRAQQIVEDLEKLMGGDVEPLTFFFQKAIPTGPKPIMAFRPNFTHAEMLDMGIKPDTPAYDSIMNDNGKLVWLEVDPRAYNVLMSLSTPNYITKDSGWLFHGLAQAAKPIRMATTLNPDFVVRNLTRDPFARQMFTQQKGMDAGVLTAYGKLYQSFVERVKGTQEWDLFKAMGLEGATIFGTELGREMQMRIGPGGGVIHGIYGAAKKVGEAFSVPEMLLRFDEFKAIRQQKLAEGASDMDALLEATLAAKEVTVNFTRRGASASAINQLVPYFSPGLAGVRKFWRAVGGAEGKDLQRRALIQGITNIGGAAALFYLLHGDEEWYQELPMWRRINYFNTKLPDGTIMSFPKPFEPGIFFSAPIELGLMGIRDQFDSKLAKEMAWTFAKQHFVGFPWIPAPILPLAEQIVNWSLFKGREVVPGWLQKTRVPADQYTAYTGEVYKWLGHNLGVSPARIEHFFTSYTGGFARQVTRAVETMVGVKEYGGFEDTPGLGVFFRQKEGQQSRSVDELYELAEALGQRAGSKVLTPAEESMRPLINKAIHELSEIRARQRAGTISVEASRLQQMRAAKDALQTYRRMTGR